MIKGIHHISMKCKTEEELRKVKEFYIEILGLKVCREWTDGFMLDTGNGMIEIFTNAEGEHRLGAIRHVALLTDDVMARIPSATNVTACVDSALLYYDGWLQTARDLWRAPDAICERLTGDNIVLDELVALRRSHNGVKILFTGSTRDHDLQIY